MHACMPRGATGSMQQALPRRHSRACMRRRRRRHAHLVDFVKEARVVLLDALAHCVVRCAVGLLALLQRLLVGVVDGILQIGQRADVQLGVLLEVLAGLLVLAVQLLENVQDLAPVVDVDLFLRMPMHRRNMCACMYDSMSDRGPGHAWVGCSSRCDAMQVLGPWRCLDVGMRACLAACRHRRRMKPAGHAR